MLTRNDNTPFDLLTYFEGRTLASGIFANRSGQMKRRFEVDVTGRSHGNHLNLHEQFRFEDGEEHCRTWLLQREPGWTFSGTAEDCVGMARGGFLQGQAWMESVLRLSAGRRTMAVRFRDVFYPAGTGLVLSRSTVSKWGLVVGQVLISFRKA